MFFPLVFPRRPGVFLDMATFTKYCKIHIEINVFIFCFFVFFSENGENSNQKLGAKKRPNKSTKNHLFLEKNRVFLERKPPKINRNAEKSVFWGIQKSTQKNKRAQRFPKRVKGAKKVVQGEMTFSRGAASLRARATGKGREGVNPSPGTGDWELLC